MPPASPITVFALYMILLSALTVARGSRAGEVIAMKCILAAITVKSFMVSWRGNFGG